MKKQLGKWVSNTFDPSRSDKELCFHYGPIPEGDTEQYLAEYRQWVNQFEVGEPKATNWYSVEELVESGMVGLYEKVTT